MAVPYRVGVLNDMSDGPPDPYGGVEEWLRLAVDEVRAAGRLDRDVEFVHSWGLGLPSGTAAAVERAFRTLAEQDVLLVVGPAIGDDALVATPLVEQHRLPTINWAGAERARGEYMFHLQVGSHEDESIVLARHVAATGAGRVAVVYDRSPIGRKHLQFFQSEAEVIGVDLSAAVGIDPLAEAAEREVTQLLKSGADAVVYLGLGLSTPAVATELTARGFDGPRAMNTAGLRGHQPEYGRIIDGWVYVDMFSERNQALLGLCERVGMQPRQAHAACRGYDLGRLAAEGLARAPERTREGVKHGLEQIKWLPAAEGHDGTLLGFGVYDRGALHGRYLVLRQWRDGVSIEL